MVANKPRITSRATALLLTFALLNVFVLAGASTTKANTSAGEVTANKMLAGRLSLASEQSMFVNGNQAVAGTTIFSGMRLQTPEGVDAAVQLGALGSIKIEPQSDLTLEFSNGSVEIKVMAGDVALTTNAGVNGTLTTADGRILRSNKALAGTLTSSNKTKAARALSKGQKAALIILPIVAAIIIIAVVVHDDDDESPNNP